MFRIDNFLVSFIRASPGTVLKGTPPPLARRSPPYNWITDKVHISLIMEALGKYKEPVSSLINSHAQDAPISCGA